jgi:hypothetical protein
MQTLRGLSKCAAATSSRLAFRRRPAQQQLRQLGDVGRDAPRIVAGEELGRRSPSRLVLEIDVGECLPIVVADDEARVGLLDGPGRREAARQIAIIEIGHEPRGGPVLGAGQLPRALWRCAIKRLVADRRQEKAPRDGGLRGFSDRKLG